MSDTSNWRGRIPVYFFSSSSGMVRQFAERLERPVFDLAVRDVRRSVPAAAWVLLTPSYKTGNRANDTIPEAVRRFLWHPLTRRRLVGVMGSGNRNFGSHYQAACRQIARASGRPVLFEFELQGTPWDVEDGRRILAALDADRLSIRDDERTNHDDALRRTASTHIDRGGFDPAARGMRRTAEHR
ncbi:class Ib ribonucleoside-diphosphate reductase assembly flavoprotein NrdI [Microbacterium sp. CIAB417]|uniref:class Ib ribonucleoside-diphosphate reductase assembly flavoprotein NrdI n=1 Tax=Microbacterium sp. CIAB417 TaxID=2860287 RepID=UPI0027E2EDE4|nr:class Ib ribonucleoside-diphosphate reductase assembly flavoprotein NrdI [Microbacterium sp. CIAB417]